jgi:hypothetical protein
VSAQYVRRLFGRSEDGTAAQLASERTWNSVVPHSSRRLAESRHPQAANRPRRADD